MLQKRRRLGQILLLVILFGLCSLTAVRIDAPDPTDYPTEHPTFLGAKHSGNDFVGAIRFSPLQENSELTSRTGAKHSRKKFTFRNRVSCRLPNDRPGMKPETRFFRRPSERADKFICKHGMRPTRPYREAKQTEEALALTQEIKPPEMTNESAQELANLLNQSQLTDIPEAMPRRGSEKEIAINQVDPDTAVIYPIILPDRLEVIFALPGHPLVRTSILEPKETIETTIRQMRNSLRRTSFLEERLPLAQKLYDWLIRPIAEDLASKEIKTLVFVLDGPFRNVPMAALHDGQQYLVEKYAIAINPSLQLLAERRSSLRPEKISALLGGLSEATQGFSPLPAVDLELAAIAAEIPTEILRNQAFTRDALTEKMVKTSFPVIHLATHGQFSSNSEETFILTWDDKIKVKDLQSILRDRRRQTNPLELLVLSACQTAEGDNRATLGLAGMAVRSGARSTLATLWSVNDQSTAAFMAEFYRQLTQPNITKAEAQRLGQIKLLKDPKYRHPFYWAPFVLVGNWQ
jgi:CHAT domain-containing protein